MYLTAVGQSRKILERRSTKFNVPDCSWAEKENTGEEIDKV